MTHEQYVRRCLELATATLAEGEVPVGAVIVDGGRIVGEGAECTSARRSECARRRTRRPGRVPATWGSTGSAFVGGPR